MPTHKPSLARLTTTQLADLTGCALKTVSKRLGEAGVEPIAEDGKTLWYNPRVALPAILGVGGALDPIRERAALDAVKRQIEEIKLAELRGEVVRSDEVQSALVAATSAVRARLLAVPSGTAQELAAAGDPAECHAITERAIHEALQDLADAKVEDPDRRRGRAARSGEGGALGSAATSETDGSRVG